jgi:hypothetical protein
MGRLLFLESGHSNVNCIYMFRVLDYESEEKWTVES